MSYLNTWIVRSSQLLYRHDSDFQCSLPHSHKRPFYCSCISVCKGPGWQRCRYPVCHKWFLLNKWINGESLIILEPQDSFCREKCTADITSGDQKNVLFPEWNGRNLNVHNTLTQWFGFPPISGAFSQVGVVRAFVVCDTTITYSISHSEALAPPRAPSPDAKLTLISAHNLWKKKDLSFKSRSAIMGSGTVKTPQQSQCCDSAPWHTGLMVHCPLSSHIVTAKVSWGEDIQNFSPQVTLSVSPGRNTLLKEGR